MTYDYLLHPDIPKLFDHALIVFDTSALLDLYNYKTWQLRILVYSFWNSKDYSNSCDKEALSFHLKG